MSTLITCPGRTIVGIEPFKGGNTFQSIYLDELGYWPRQHAMRLKASKASMGSLFTVYYDDGTTDDFYSGEIDVIT